MGKKFTAIVLQGGGALGAYEYGVIKALYEQKNFAPDIISGVSIGAITAAILTGAKGDPIEALDELWKILTAPDIPFLPNELNKIISLSKNAGMYHLNSTFLINPYLATSVCDTSPLYNTLEKLVDHDKLNKGKPWLVVTATNVHTGEIEEFDNHGKEPITFKHIAASGSLPPFFPMTEIDNQYYWDGGVFSNTPLAPAVSRLEQLGGNDANVEREVMLIELFPKSGNVPEKMIDVHTRMSQMSFECKIRHNAQHFEKLNKYIDMIHEIDKELPANSKVRKSSEFKEFIAYKKINKLTIIEHTEPELLSGPADFTSKSIKARIEQGYKDAVAHIAKN